MTEPKKPKKELNKELEKAYPDENIRFALFEAIKKTDENGFEYWTGRELARALTYSKWDKFLSVIEKAKTACRNSNQSVDNHFLQVGKMVNIGSGTKREVTDYHLSRYACYLIIQNSDSSKTPVALGQTYFAVQTHRMEQTDILDSLTEDQKRLHFRNALSVQNGLLSEAAKEAGVETALDHATFNDYGNIGLYGETAKQIKQRKNISEDEPIADHMISDELIVNLFRTSLTRQKLKGDKVKGKQKANQTHYNVGRKVRETIREIGGTMPEEMPTPKKSIKEIEQKQKEIEKRGPQLSMFPETDDSNE